MKLVVYFFLLYIYNIYARAYIFSLSIFHYVYMIWYSTWYWHRKMIHDNLYKITAMIWIWSTFTCFFIILPKQPEIEKVYYILHCLLATLSFCFNEFTPFTYKKKMKRNYNYLDKILELGLGLNNSLQSHHHFVW